MPAVRLVRLCLPHLEQSAAGRVICITSVAVKEPTPHLALSNTIRPGVTGWAKTLARELGPKGITVNCVAPGRIDTPRMTELYGDDGPPAEELAQIPLGRMGTPREFGDVVCFLASDRAAYVTGTTVLVDGGSSRVAAVRRVVTPGRLLALGPRRCSPSSLALLVVPSSQYIFLPDPAHPVAPLVTVPGGKDPTRGGVYFVDVVVRKATLLERLFGGLHDGADLYPASAVDPPGVGERSAAGSTCRTCSRSQQIAAAVALRAAGKKVVTAPGRRARRPSSSTGKPAVGKLEPDDVIVAVNGTPRHGPKDVFTRDAEARGRRRRHFTVRRGKQTLVTRSRRSPPTRARAGRSSACSSSRRSTSTCRSTCGSTPATSAARRPASRSRSR